MRTTGRARRGTRATTACRWLQRVVHRDAGHRGQRVLSRLRPRGLFISPLQVVEVGDGAECGGELLRWWSVAGGRDLSVLRVAVGVFDGGAGAGLGGVDALVVRGDLGFGGFADRVGGGVALGAVVALV